MALFTKLRYCSPIGKLMLNASIQEISRRGIKRHVAPTLRQFVKRKEKAEPLPVELTKRSNFIEWNYNAEIYAFGKRLGEEFKIELLLQAFIHRSYIIQEELKQQQVGIENPNLSLKDNQSLAKKGEAIISKEVKRFLAISLPRLPLEGIDAIHEYLLSDETLGDISKYLGTSDIVLSADYPVEVETLAKTLKAVVGALAQSQNIERANKFVRDLILTRLAEQDINELYVIDDPVQVLSDILARDGRDPPEPRLISQSASNDILACHTVGIYCSKELIGQGPGETVDIAVEMAARDALKRLFLTSDNAAPLTFNASNNVQVPTNLKLSSWNAAAFQSPA